MLGHVRTTWSLSGYSRLIRQSVRIWGRVFVITSWSLDYPYSAKNLPRLARPECPMPPRMNADIHGCEMVSVHFTLERYKGTTSVSCPTWINIPTKEEEEKIPENPLVQC